MKKRKLIDFFLPFPWNIHARILCFCLFGSIVFGMIFGHGNFLQSLALSGSIMFFDCEIIFWISRRLFNSTKVGSPRNIIFQVLWRVVVFFLMIIVVGTIVPFMVFLISQMWSGKELSVVFQNLMQFELKGNLISSIIAALFATLIFFFIIWQDAMKSAFKVREQMLIYQSETLRNQVNPHFLFNSLNTLSSLITSNPDKAEAFTDKLSQIYRYILENREEETVLMEQEMAFVNDFYFLQKIRDEEKIELTTDIENEKCRVLPVSIQLLVENAFKHNIATRDKPLKVSIKQKGEWVEVSNNLQPKKQLGTTSGQGLKNLEERIKIQTGKKLEIEKNDLEFIVGMPLICK
jgi:two-component system, LytTR family, sensor kinase